MAENFDLLDFSPSESTPTEPSSGDPEPSPEPGQPVSDEPEGSEPEDRESALLARLEEETGQRLALERNVPAEDSPEPVVVSEPNFLENLDIDEVLSNSENLNKLLLAVYNAGISEATRRASDNILGSVNDLVSRYVREQINMTEMVKEFYDANPDLRPVRRTVAAIAREISKEEPELKPGDVFAKTALKVREVLKLKAPGVTTTKPGSKSFVQQRGRKTVEPELTGVEKEIMELMEI